MIYVLGVLLFLYFFWRFGGLFRAWRSAGYPADPSAARSVRFIVGVILTTTLAVFFLWMSPRVTPGLVVSMVGAGIIVIGMQFIRENLARSVGVTSPVHEAAEREVEAPTEVVSALDPEPDDRADAQDTASGSESASPGKVSKPAVAGGEDSERSSRPWLR